MDKIKVLVKKINKITHTFWSMFFRFLPFKKKIKLLTQSGLTLIEILAVVTLLGILTTISIQLLNKKDSKDLIAQTKEQLERVFSVASNEAMVRNKLIRLRFNLDKDPTPYQLEVSNNSELLPPTDTSSESSFDIKTSSDKENDKKKEEEFDQQFTTLSFSQLESSLGEGVKFAAMENVGSKKLHTNGFVDLYFFPTSEKSNALLVFLTTEEAMLIELQPIKEELAVDYKPLPPGINLEQATSYLPFIESWLKSWQSQ